MADRPSARPVGRGVRAALFEWRRGVAAGRIEMEARVSLAARAPEGPAFTALADPAACAAAGEPLVPATRRALLDLLRDSVVPLLRDGTAPTVVPHVRRADTAGLPGAERLKALIAQGDDPLVALARVVREPAPCSPDNRTIEGRRP